MSHSIKYRKEANSSNIKVYLADRLVGKIRPVKGGWAYFPKGSETSGATFEHIIECKKSLESPD